MTYENQTFYIALVISVFIFIRRPKIELLTLSYMLASGIFLSLMPKSPYLSRGAMWVLSTDIIASHSLICLMLAILFALLIAPHRYRSLIAGVGFLNSIMVIFNTQNHNALMANTAMDANLIALCLPAIFSTRMNRALYVIPFVAIGLTTSSTGIGLALLALILHMGLSLRTMLLAPLAAIPAILYVGVGTLLDDQQRFQLWQKSMAWWSEQANHWYGTGIGTFFVIGPYVQKLDGNKGTGLFTFMHNDWLQVLFELGIIGFVLTVIVFITATLAARRSKWLMHSILLYGASAIFNMPTRYMLTGVLGIMLLRRAHKKGPFLRGPNLHTASGRS